MGQPVRVAMNARSSTVHKLRSLDVGSPVWVRSNVDCFERLASIHFFGSSMYGSEYGLSVWDGTLLGISLGHANHKFEIKVHAHRI